MDNLFSIGELAKFQNISKQTLIFYDKIDLFKPSYVDPENGYRYYTSGQLDYLDTILIMKKIGFSLKEIKNHMKNYTTENSLAFLNRQLTVINDKIQELSLIKSRVQHRCDEIKKACESASSIPELCQIEDSYILYHNVKPPFDMREISLATKKCYAQSSSCNLPVFFQCGVSVPLAHINSGDYTKASLAFLTTENTSLVSNIRKLPAGLTVSLCHFGNYYSSIADSYRILLAFCDEQHLEIISDSYEFCINDYITSKNEEEFITKIMFYVKKANK